MSDNDDRKINLRRGESKKISLEIPLVVQGDDKPEVQPKYQEIKKINQDQTQNNEKTPQGLEANNQDQTQTQNNENLSTLGKMNQRPERRKDNGNQKGNNYNNKDSQEKGSVLAANWNKLRAFLKRKNKNSVSKNFKSTSESMARLASFEFYRLCWLNLIDSFGLTYFGLLFLFIRKYIASNPKVVKFVSLKDSTIRAKIIKNQETTDYLMMIAFAGLTILILFLIVIAIIFLIFVMKAMNATIWGLLKNPAEWWNSIKFFIALIHDLIF